MCHRYPDILSGSVPQAAVQGDRSSLSMFRSVAPGGCHGLDGFLPGSEAGWEIVRQSHGVAPLPLVGCLGHQLIAAVLTGRMIRSRREADPSVVGGLTPPSNSAPAGQNPLAWHLPGLLLSRSSASSLRALLLLPRCHSHELFHSPRALAAKDWHSNKTLRGTINVFR
jgi:hypothetical protein